MRIAQPQEKQGGAGRAETAVVRSGAVPLPVMWDPRPVALDREAVPPPWRLLESIGRNGPEHIHLDELVPDPPAPGSMEWLPVLDEVLGFLMKLGGPWYVSLPLGQCKALPGGDLSTEGAARLASREHLMEPPAVYRIAADLSHAVWDGESYCWTRVHRTGAVEAVTASRSRAEGAALEPWTLRVGFAIEPLTVRVTTRPCVPEDPTVCVARTMEGIEGPDGQRHRSSSLQELRRAPTAV